MAEGAPATCAGTCHDRPVSSSPNSSPAGVRPHHALTVIVVAIVAVVLAYVVLGWVVGVVLFLVRTVVVLAVIALTVYLVLRWAGRGPS
jgi:small-conductance mechanosensitive channel